MKFRKSYGIKPQNIITILSTVFFVWNFAPEFLCREEGVMIKVVEILYVFLVRLNFNVNPGFRTNVNARLFKYNYSV